MVGYRFIVAVIALVGLLGGAALLPQEGSAQTPGDIPTVDGEPLRMITVTGTGEVRAEPNYALIRVGVQTQAETAQAALEQNNQQVQALLDVLEAAGVAAGDIQTQVVQLQPQYRQPSPELVPANGGIVGYIASNIVEVTVRDLDGLGQLLDASVQAGGNVIENIRFEVSDPEELLQQARIAALENARLKAEQLASAAGAGLGEVLIINSLEGGPGPLPATMAMQADMAAVPIRPGTEPLQVQVQVTWRLQ